MPAVRHQGLHGDQQEGKSRDYRWHLGCILPRVPAIIVRQVDEALRTGDMERLVAFRADPRMRALKSLAA